MGMLETSDGQLVEQYLKGDEASLAILVKRYLAPIYGFVFRYVGAAPDAEDIAQEVFLRAWRNIKKFDRKKSFKTWIFAIAKNAAIDFLKKKKDVPFREFENEEGDNFLAETIEDPAPLPDEIFERGNLAQILNSALEAVSPKYRAVLILHYNDYFTFREIAEVLGESLNTVKSRHRRALVELRKFLIAV